MRIEAKNELTQMRSLVTIAISRYSALVEECDTIVCFYVLYEMGDPPNVTK